MQNRLKNLLFLCLSTLSLFACKKKDQAAADYTINGIHAITFGNQKSDTMSFSVDALEGGAEESITLSIDGLPADLTASLSQTSGTPTFHSILTINRQESSAGTHTINLIGISAGGKRKAYPVTVVVPALRDIRFDGSYYTISSAVNDSASSRIILNTAQQMTLDLYLPAGLPNKAGTYNYRVTAALPLTGEAQLILWVGAQYFVPGNNQSGKISLNLDTTGTITNVYLPDIEVSTEFAPILYRTLGINYNK